MAQSSTILLPDTNQQWDMTGEAIRADGLWATGSSTHTFAIHLNHFTGWIWLEASLAETPGDTDWFPIYIGDTTPYLDCTNESGVKSYSVVLNTAWLRARLDRNYLGKQPTDWSLQATYGVIRQILWNN